MGSEGSGPVVTELLSKYIVDHCCWTWGDFESRLRGPFLLVKSGTSEPVVMNLEEFLKEPGSTLTMGRSLGVEVVLDDDTVSREHARLHRKDGHWYLTDLDSSNGCYHQNRLVPRVPFLLEDGCEVLLGRSTRLHFHEVGSFYLMTYEDMKAAREDLPVDQRRHRGTTRRVTSQRLRPAVMLEAQRDHPRSAARLAREMASSSYEDFVRFFPYPVLLELSTQEKMRPEQPMRTLLETAIAERTSLGDLAFWIVTSAVDPDSVLIGRASNNDVCLPYPSIARRHAQISGRGQGEERSWSIADLSDRSGLWIDGEPVKGEAALPGSAALRLGRSNLFQFLSPRSFWELLKLFDEYPYLHPM